MRLGKIATLGAAALIVVSLGTASAGGNRVTGRYIGGTPAGGGFLPLSGPSFTLPDHPNIGGLWMLVPAGRTRLAVTVADDYSDAVAADVLFLVDEYAPLIPSKRFCNSASGLPIPAGTTSLYVRVVALGSLKCDPPGLPTQGTITAIFR